MLTSFKFLVQIFNLGKATLVLTSDAFSLTTLVDRLNKLILTDKFLMDLPKGFQFEVTDFKPNDNDEFFYDGHCQIVITKYSVALLDKL